MTSFLNISMSKTEHRAKIDDLLSINENTWRIKYNRPNDAQSWKYLWAKEDASKNKAKELSKISYRPFDDRWTLYTAKLELEKCCITWNIGLAYIPPDLPVYNVHLSSNGL